MSSRILPALFLVSAVAVAQQTAPNSVGSQGTSTQVQQGTQTQVQGAQSGNNTTAQAVQATNLDAELKSSLDSKKAKQGDQVTAVTKSAAVLNGDSAGTTSASNSPVRRAIGVTSVRLLAALLAMMAPTMTMPATISELPLPFH